MSENDKDELKENSNVEYSDVNNNVWLVKIPTHMFDIWKNERSGKIIGKVNIVHPSKKTARTPLRDYKFSVESFNTKFNLYTRKPRPMYIFKRSNNTNNISIDSSIKAMGNLVPTGNLDMYKKVITKKNREEQKSLKMIQVQVDNTFGGVNVLALNRERTERLTKRKKRKSVHVKMNKDDLLDILFDRFKKQKHWSINDLYKDVKQPMRYLRQILEEIAFIHRTGRHRSFWELKVEHRTRDENSEIVEKDEWI